MTQHTPGPWRRYGVFVRDTNDTLGGMIMVRTSAGTGGEFIGAFVTEEDAELAAAAPAMLAALKEALKLTEYVDDHGRLSGGQMAEKYGMDPFEGYGWVMRHNKAARMRINAAIAAAEGR